MVSIAPSLVEVVQHCNNVEKSAKLYAALGFQHAPIAPDTASLLLTATASTSNNNAANNGTNSNSNSNNLAAASGVVIRLLHVSASVKLPAPVPSTLLRCVVASPQSVVRDLIDSGWTRLVGGDSEGVWQFMGCDGQLLQIITADKQAAAASTESLLNVSSGGVSKGSRRTHRHESGSGSKSGSLRHHKSASLRHHHRHHHHHHSATPDGAAAPAAADGGSTTTPTPPTTTPTSAPTVTVTAASRTTPLQVGFHTDIGQRESNEDAHLTELALPFDANTALFAVFDGHGGSKASRFCEKKFVSFLEKTKAYATDKSAALTEAFIKCDKKYIERVEDDGCTALVVLLTADNHLYVAHAGDSRAILVPSAGDVVALTADHKPEQPKEKKRIEAAGHEVVRDTIVQHGKRVHTFRIDSVLSVARSIGDAEYKDSFDLDAAEQAVTCVPDVSDRKVAPGDIVVLACDGLFDVMSNELVAEKVRKFRAAGDSLDAAAKKLTESAIQELGSDDNVSVVLVEIPK